MADKEWSELTLEEKCDNLRLNVERLYTIAGNVATETRRLENQLIPRINEVAKAVEKLEAQMRAKGDK